jgi:hypothetical protein
MQKPVWAPFGHRQDVAVGPKQTHAVTCPN